jgi:hypothetical protein
MLCFLHDYFEVNVKLFVRNMYGGIKVELLASLVSSHDARMISFMILPLHV